MLNRMAVNVKNQGRDPDICEARIERPMSASLVFVDITASSGWRAFLSAQLTQELRDCSKSPTTQSSKNTNL